MTIAIDELHSVVNESDVELGRLGALSADLTSYAASLEEMSLIDQITAVSIEALCPGAIDTQKYPLAGFTQKPSKTNYTASLEGIGDKLIEIGKRIIQSILTALRKVGEFFIKLWNSLNSRDTRQTETEEQIKETEKAITYLITNSPPELKAEVETAVKEARTSVDVILHSKIAAMNRGLLQSIIKKDHIHRAVLAMGTSYIDFLKTIVERIVLVDAELRVVTSNASLTDKAVENVLKEVERNQYQNSPLVSDLTALHLLRSSHYTPMEFTAAIQSLKNLVSDKYSEIESNHLPTSAQIFKSGAGDSFIHHPEKINSTYSNLVSQVNKLDSFTTKPMPVSMHRPIVSLASLIRSEYHAASNFLAIAATYASIGLEVTRLELAAAEEILRAGQTARRKPKA